MAQDPDQTSSSSGELALEDLEEIPGPPPPPVTAPPPPVAAPPPPVAAPPRRSAPPPVSPAARRSRPAPPPAPGEPQGGNRPPRPTAVATSAGATASTEDAWVAFCEAQLSDEQDPARRARLRCELGRAWTDAGDLERAAAAFEAALGDAPDHLAALRGLRRVREAEGRWPRVVALLDRELASSADPSHRGALLRRKAEILEAQTGDPSAAVAAYEQAAQADPAHLGGLLGLARLHRRAGAWRELADVYSRLAASVRDARLRGAWLARQAHVTETHLGDPSSALQLYEAAASAAPEASSALLHVTRLAQMQGDTPRWVAATRRQLELATEPRVRHRLFVALGDALAQAGDRDGALDALRGALAEVPSDRDARRRLAALHASRGEWAEHLEVLAPLVDQTPEPTARARLCHRLARVAIEHLKDDAAGRGWLVRAFDADPRFEPAAQDLCARLEAAGAWLELARVLERRAEHVSEPSAQAALWHRAALVFEERLGRPDEAAERHDRALTAEPDHAEAFAALARLHTAAGRWHALAELYRRAADHAPHASEAAAWLTRLGAVLEDRLDDVVGALLAYERVLALRPDDLAAHHAVQRAAERAGRHARLVDALRAEARLTTDAARRDALLHRAATVLLDHLDDQEGARRALQEILARSPDHAASLETLARLEAVAGRWEALRQVHARQLAATRDPGERARLNLRIGDLEAQRLGRPAAAIAAYRAALADDPDLTAAREALLAALEGAQQWRALATELEATLERATAAPDRATLALKLGRLYEQRLGDAAAALAAYERAVEADPLHREALDARRRLLVDAGDVEALGRALDAEAQACPDPAVRAAVQLERTLVEVRHAPDAPARERAAAFLREHPESVGAILAAEEVGLRLGDPSASRAAYVRLAGVASDPAAVLASLQELVRLRRLRGEPLLPVLERIRSLDAGDVATLEALVEEGARAQDPQLEGDALAQLAAARRAAPLSADDLARLGRLRLRLGDARGALEAFRAACAADGRDLGARRGLTRAAQILGDPDALREAARGERDVTRDRAMALRAFLQAAERFAEAEREDEAAACYAEALETDPDSPEAAMGLMATSLRSERVPWLVERLAHASRAAVDPFRATALLASVALLQADLLGDLPAAVASTRASLARRPGDVAAMARLADYLERAGQWSAAAETLEALLPRLVDDAQVATRLRLADLRENHLLDFDAAAEDLRWVLSVREDEPAALASLVRVERLRGDDAEALRLVRRLLAVVSSDADRARALAELAELERDRGAFEAAAQAALEAIARVGPIGPAGEVYRALLAETPPRAPAEGYAQALTQFLAQTSKPAEQRAAAYRELARVAEGAPEGLQRAVSTLRRGAEDLPRDPTIAHALIAALRRTGRADEALAEARRWIGVHPRDAAAWRTLSELLGAAGDDRARRGALAPLVALRQASAEEQRAVAERAAEVAAWPPGAFSPRTLRHLFGDGTFDDPWASLLPAVGEVVAKLEGVEYARWGVSRRERLRAGDAHPVRALADRIAAIFGAPEFDLFLLEGENYRHAFVLAGTPPALMVPELLTRAPAAALAYEIARPLALIARQVPALDHVEDDRLQRLLVALVRHFEPTFIVGAQLEQHQLDALDEETRRIGKAVGFFARGRVQEAVQRFVAGQVAPLATWAREVRLEASKVALLTADDLLAVIATLGEAIGPDNEATELARFSVSAEALRFRRVVGGLETS